MRCKRVIFRWRKVLPRIRRACALPMAFATIGIAATMVGCARIVPERPQFDAMAKVRELCALGARDSGTLGCANAAGWIADSLAAAGLVPFTDAYIAYDGDICRNVIASIPGGEKHVLLMSHYDTKAGISQGFVGANDGASSTALLIKLAEWFATHPEINRPTLTFAFLDGEECRVEYGPKDGLQGSRRLAGLMKNSRTRIDAAILLDMVGDADLTLTIPANGDRRLMAQLMQAAKRLEIADKVKRHTADMLDDHQPFLELGYPAIDIIDFEYGSAPGLNDYWHTPHDTPDKLSNETLDAVGALVIDMVRQM